MRYDNVQVVFMDTLFEDDDNYRFMNECKDRWGVPITILTEGRTPYQVAEDQHIIPNDRVAPCTRRLKIELFKRWIEKLQKPITIHIGYDYLNDAHRMDRTRDAYEALGYSVDFPLTWQPIEYRDYSIVVREDWGIEPPRMYAMGYTHANCGGRCVKQGWGDWIRTLINFPDRYAEVEEWEQQMRQHPVRQNYSILKDQSGGMIRPKTLKELREDYQNNGGQMSLFEMDSKASCLVCGIGADDLS